MRFKRVGMDRGLTPVVGAALMIVIVVILSAMIAILVTDLGNELGTDTERNPNVGMTVDEVVLTGTGDCGTGEELALDVTLDIVTRADEIYVRADGGSGQVIWSNPSASIGSTKRVANENTGTHGVDVDIGGGGDDCIAPDDDVQFVFYATYDNETKVFKTWDH